MDGTRRDLSPPRIGRTNDPDRVAWVEACLRELPQGASLLDVGAGELRFKRASAHLLYTAQDFGRYDGRGDARGLQTGTFDQTGIDILSDITNIPRPSASFDAILCTEVLEHVPDPLSALDELARLLRPGGRLILTMPFVSYTHFSPHHYHTGFSRYWYEHWLPRKGFAIRRLEPAGPRGFFDLLAQEIDRAPTIWRMYGGHGLRGSVVQTALRIGARVVMPLFGWLERRTPRSVEFATHRWCCLAERL